MSSKTVFYIASNMLDTHKSREEKKRGTKHNGTLEEQDEKLTRWLFDSDR